MTVASQGKLAQKPPYKFVLGLSAFWTVVVALTGIHHPGAQWWWYPLFGLLSATATILVVAALLWMFGVGGFLAFVAFAISVVLWTKLGPVPTIIIGGGIAYLLWRYRFQIGRRFGLQVPERAASSADTSSAAASNQDSNSGTVN